MPVPLKARSAFIVVIIGQYCNSCYEERESSNRVPGFPVAMNPVALSWVESRTEGKSMVASRSRREYTHTHIYIYGVEREIERERSAKNSKIPNESIIDHYKMRRDKKRETVPPLCIGRSTDSRRGAKIRAAWILRDINRKRNDRDERKEEEGRSADEEREREKTAITAPCLHNDAPLPFLPPPPPSSSPQEQHTTLAATPKTN